MGPQIAPWAEKVTKTDALTHTNTQGQNGEHLYESTQ